MAAAQIVLKVCGYEYYLTAAEAQGKMSEDCLIRVVKRKLGAEEKGAAAPHTEDYNSSKLFFRKGSWPTLIKVLT